MINPFDIVRLEGATPQVTPHLDRLKSIFNASFPMYEILPVILEEGLVELYDSQGWLDDELPPPGVAAPTLETLHNRISNLVREKGYEERITANITAALRTRIRQPDARLEGKNVRPASFNPLGGSVRQAGGDQSLPNGG